MTIGAWVPTTDLSLGNISDTQENFKTNKQASTKRQDETNSNNGRLGKRSQMCLPEGQN